MKRFPKILNRARKQKREARKKHVISASPAGFAVESLEPRVLMSGDPLLVTQFTATASGFDVQFDQTVDRSTLNLFDTEAGTLGPADVTVVGNTEGNVKGSLSVDNNTIHFVRTGGALASDTYTVTLRSGANGVKAVGGGLLDGDADGVAGGDYVHGFTIAPFAGVTIAIPDFARGPGQVVNIPAPGVGIPVSISDGTGVSTVDFTLTYDPALLRIVAANPGEALPVGTSVQSDLSTPGTLSVHIASPAPMNSGPLDLVRVVAEVPHTAAYGQAGFLDLSQVSINGGAIAGRGDDGIQVAAHFGEATGNRAYSALDGSRILRVVVGLDSGFAAYPSVDPILLTDITGNGILSSLDGTRILQEVVGLDRAEIAAITALILAGLSGDTGVSSGDGVTFDPSVSGTTTDDGVVTSFLARVDGSPFVDVTTDLQGNAFSFDRARLEQILGGSLGDGSHTLSFQATDNAGNVSTVSSFGFTLDTAPPAITALGLSPGSDTGTPGDNITSAAQVLLIGAGEAGATLKLNAIAVLAGAGGVFQIPNVALADGSNAFTLTATDAAGNNAQRGLTVTRQGAVTADVALQWNQQALEAIRLTVMDPPVATRVLAMVSLAQYDTLAAIEGTPAYLVRQSVSGPVSLDAALAKAAHTVLYALFPSLRATFDAALNSLLSTIPADAARSNALALGLAVGNGVLAIRAQDGSDVFVDYPGSAQIGAWRPTAPMFETAETPQWGEVTPFALTSNDQFRPELPPSLDSAEYAASVEEIRSLGSATSTTRTSDQTEQAQFWADGKGSYTPVGHWNQIAQQIALSKGNSLSSNVRLLAELNVALADAAIAAWDAKYYYGLWRPIDAIHNAGLDNNPATLAEANWTPLLITPFHPEYVSGHSTFSASAAEILAATFGDNTAFSTTAFTLPGVTRSFTSFTEAAAEAGRSRIYGGIHYEFTNQAGQELGRQVAEAVLNRFALSQDAQAPIVVADSLPAVTNTNMTLTGQIIDNLSGVAETQYWIDDGAPQILTLNAEGRFSIVTAFALNGAADGLHTIHITAEDAANNIAPVFTRSFTLDTVLPAIALNSIADNAAIDAGSRLIGIANPTGSAIIELNYRFDTNQPRSMTFDGAGAFNEQLVLGNLTEGAHVLTLTARDAAGNQATLTRNVTLPQAAPFTLTGVSPIDGAIDIGVTFHPQVLFSRSVDVATLTSNTFFATGADGQKLPATIVPAQDGSFAWLFFTSPLPGASTVTLHVDGESIRAAADHVRLDADGDGVAGGVFTSTFSTVSRSSIPGTQLIGKVVDPGPDLEPMTFDDIRRGPDGIIHTADDVFLNPIVHAKVFILGQEERLSSTLGS